MREPTTFEGVGGFCGDVFVAAWNAARRGPAHISAPPVTAEYMEFASEKVGADEAIDA